MDLEEVIELFSERPFKMTSMHRSLLVKLIAIARAADEWAFDTEDSERIDNLIDSVQDLREFDQ